MEDGLQGGYGRADYRAQLGEALGSLSDALEAGQHEMTAELRGLIAEDAFLRPRLTASPSHGRRPDLWLYRWVNVIFEEPTGGERRCYDIAMSQQLLDPRTGNPHTAFGKVQFWRDLVGDAEKGGNPFGPCPRLRRMPEDPGEGRETTGPDAAPRPLDCSESDFLRLDYHAWKAFPAALTRSNRPRLEDERPWGLRGFVWPAAEGSTTPQAPQLDMAAPDFDPRHVARCFLALVRADLAEKGLLGGPGTDEGDATTDTPTPGPSTGATTDAPAGTAPRLKEDQ